MNKLFYGHYDFKKDLTGNNKVLGDPLRNPSTLNVYSYEKKESKS